MRNNYFDPWKNDAFVERQLRSLQANPRVEQYQREEVVLILGAGASISFDIPMTSGLINGLPVEIRELFNNLKQDYQNLTLEEFTQKINDLENFSGSESKKILDYFGYSRRDSTNDPKSIKSIIFSHIRDKCRIGDDQINQAIDIYQTLFEPIISSNLVTLKVFTTNYDDVIEKVCSKLRWEYDDGFNYNKHEKDHIWSNSFGSHAIQYYKLHGSINWYVDYKNKIRTIPFIGSDLESTGLNMKTSMIYPIQHKEIFSEPFSSLYTHYVNSLQKAKWIFVIGFSFSDANIITPLKDRMEKNQTKLTIISPSASNTFARLKWNVKAEMITAIDSTFENWINEKRPKWQEMIDNIQLKNQEIQSNQNKALESKLKDRNRGKKSILLKMKENYDSGHSLGKGEGFSISLNIIIFLSLLGFLGYNISQWIQYRDTENQAGTFF